MKYKDKNEERAWEMFRKSVGPHIWTGRDLGTWFAMGVFVGAMIIAPFAFSDDNIITIEQTGDNLLLEFDQEGNGNVINTVFSGVYLDTAMSQQGVRNQVLRLSQGVSGDNNQVVVEQWNNTTSGNYNKIWIDIDGDNNGVDVGQGCKFYYASSTECSRDTHEDAGHEMEINITGDDNWLRGGQKAGTANPDHNLTIDINSNNNQVWFTQAGSGEKNLDLTINNDDNTVSVHQHYGAHTATIDLDGTAPTNLYMNQTGGPSQTYTLTQYCVTAGGCSVSVVQQ